MRQLALHIQKVLLHIRRAVVLRGSLNLRGGDAYPVPTRAQGTSRLRDPRSGQICGSLVGADHVSVFAAHVTRHVEDDVTDILHVEHTETRPDTPVLRSVI